MPFIFRIDRRICWLTVSKTADRSSRMRTEDLEAALASLRVSITESRAVSAFETRLFCARNEKIWLKITRSSVFAMNEEMSVCNFLDVLDLDWVS